MKEPEDILQVQKYWPVPVYDYEKLRSRKALLGDSGILRSCTNGPQGSPWQDACHWVGTEEVIETGGGAASNADHFFHAPAANLHQYAEAVRDLCGY